MDRLKLSSAVRSPYRCDTFVTDSGNPAPNSPVEDSAMRFDLEGCSWKASVGKKKRDVAIYAKQQRKRMINMIDGR